MCNHHSWLCWPFLIITRWEEFVYVNNEKLFSAMGHLTTNNPLSRIIIYSHICCSVWDLKNISPLSSICYCFLQHHRCITVSTRLRSRQVGLHYCHSCISSEYDNFTPCISHCCADKTQQKMSLGAFCSEVGLAVPAVIPLHQHMLHLH